MKLLFTMYMLGCVSIAHTQFSNFSGTPTKNVSGDSTYYQWKGALVYDYFIQRFDSSLVYSMDPAEYLQIEVVSNITGNGSSKIFFKDKLIRSYEITETRISGIGQAFSQFGKLEYVAMFENEALNGTSTFFDPNGFVTEIVIFKKGRFKKYLYHYQAKSKERLRRLNKNSEGPFAPMVSYQFEKK